MPLPHRLRLHPLIESDIASIQDWIGDYAGHRIAARKTREITKSIAGLAARPHQGTRRDEIVAGLRSVPSAGNGVIVFRVDDEAREVLVLLVTYGGADWMARVGRRTR